MVVCLADIRRSPLYKEFSKRSSVVGHLSSFLSEYEKENEMARMIQNIVMGQIRQVGLIM